MKKILVVLMSLIFSFVFVACGNKEKCIICHNCNYELSETDLFCGNCGIALNCEEAETKTLSIENTTFTENAISTENATSTENTTSTDNMILTNENCDANFCNEARANYSKYCAYHKCDLCTNQKEEGSLFCSWCNCQAVNCVVGKYRDSGYCIEHKCKSPSCSNAKQFNGNSSYAINYCSLHDCQECMRDRYGDSFYCSEHKCSVSGCINKYTNTFGGISYCNNHKPR